MKSRAILPAALAVGVLYLAAASNAHAFELLDRILLAGGCGCEAAPSCCEPSCCKTPRCHVHLLHRHRGCCASKCEVTCGAEPMCGVEPTCAAAPSCGCDKGGDACCRPHRCGGLLKKLLSCHASRCCEPKCGAEPACGVEPTCAAAPSCGCDKGGDACCRPHRCGGLLKKLLSCHSHKSCCAATCGCEPVCGVEPACGM